MLATFKIGCIDMAYPEHGASYEHNPKFIDRMKHAEGGKCGPYRADGGSAPDIHHQMNMPSLGNEAPSPFGERANAPLQTGTMTLGPSSGPKDIWEQHKDKGD